MKSCWKTTNDASKNCFSLLSSISTGHTPDRTQKILDLCFHSYNNDSHLLLLELRHLGWDFSGHGWFMRNLLVRPSSGERSIAINISTNQSFCYNNFEIQ